MKKAIKWILIIGVVLVVLVVVGVTLFLDSAARKGVEIGGTAALGVETKCSSVHIGLLSGSVGLKGLEIANPEGYKTDRLMALGRGKVSCDIGSLTSDEVVVQEILITEPELTIELKLGLPPKTNLGDLLKKLESDKEKAKEEPKDDAAKDEGEPKRFKVELIRITGTKVRFHLIGGKTANVTLPDIELRDVKNADGTPLMLGDIFAQVLASTGTAAINKAKLDGIAPDELLAGLGNTLGSATALLGDSGKALKEQAGKVTAELGKAAGKIKDGLKGLLGKDKKDGDDDSSKKKGLGGKLKGLFGKD